MSTSQADSKGYVGKFVRTKEGRAPLLGKAKYTNDYTFAGQLYAHILRSPHASAVINSVDVSGAKKVAGVRLVMSGREVAEYTNPITDYLDPAVFGGKSADIRPMAVDRAWCFGQPVAIVVADDANIARYAASRIQVDYTPLEAVTDAEQALAEDAPRVVPEWDDNLLMYVPFVFGDTDSAFASAAHVVSTEVGIHRFSTQPMETRCYNAVWEHDTESITLYATSQNPHPLRLVLAETLRMPENKIRIIASTIGGAFGMKMHGHPEESLLCLMAKLTGRPVKWVESREECLLIGAREQRHYLEMAFDDEGRMLGLRDRFYANLGAPSACPGWGMAFLTGLTMPGPYRVRDIDVQVHAVNTNKPSWNAARGYGKESTAIALELAMDHAARQLGMSPVELRLKNFIRHDEFPYGSPTGLMYDSGDYGGALSKALDAINHEDWLEKQAQALAEGRYIGIGVAFELTPEGGAIPGTMVAGYDSSTVRVGPDGTVRVLTGITSPGTGNATGIAQIVADELGVDIDHIEVLQGDTNASPYGFGNYSGRSTIVGGGSAALAAQDVRKMIDKVAAALLEVDLEALEFQDGLYFGRGKPGTPLSFAEVCYAAYTRAYDVALCIEPPLEVTRTFRPPSIRHTPDKNGHINPYPSYSNAAYVSVCEVDRETGKVELLAISAAHDCGKVINPVLVEGQACGAIGFGLGGVLSEEITFDEGGRQLTRSFVDYVMPRMSDVPDITMVHHDSPNPDTYLGLKGAGEAGVGGSAAAVVNSVNNALQPLGVLIHDLPLSPPRVWAAIQAAEGGH
ncbi:xanthine dehydrogenase family protein [Parahaliea maris]|uniref:Xanthine dehydrogenase family protein n=1 Tax=Parahaliea maris TaxID=2716870 RepID=A0A5C9A5F2_9GAMM|nr:xanthine dehydrogenase family protein molybdopterin-binding subunit [Parahaliea maris]TXS95966.1 xanthine dehydrogenase family protein [Parahaliea maris]